MKDFSAKENYSDTKNFDARRDFVAQYAKPHVDLYKECLKILELNGNESILDVGCGPGDLIKYIKNLGHKGKLIGIDMSEKMIEKAKSIDAEFFVQDMENIKFNENTFDVVISKHCLYHANNIDKTIKEIYRVLKPKGHFLIVLNSFGNARKKLLMLKKIMSDAIGNENILEISLRITFENYENFTLENFRTLKELRIVKYIDVKDKKPILNYLNSFREFWSPVPEEKLWENTMKLVSKELDIIIKKEKTFKEIWATGLILLQKID